MPHAALLNTVSLEQIHRDADRIIKHLPGTRRTKANNLAAVLRGFRGGYAQAKKEIESRPSPEERARRRLPGLDITREQAIDRLANDFADRDSPEEARAVIYRLMRTGWLGYDNMTDAAIIDELQRNGLVSEEEDEGEETGSAGAMSAGSPEQAQGAAGPLRLAPAADGNPAPVPSGPVDTYRVDLAAHGFGTEAIRTVHGRDLVRALGLMPDQNCLILHTHVGNHEYQLFLFPFGDFRWYRREGDELRPSGPFFPMIAGQPLYTVRTFRAGLALDVRAAAQFGRQLEWQPAPERRRTLHIQVAGSQADGSIADLVRGMREQIETRLRWEGANGIENEMRINQLPPTVKHPGRFELSVQLTQPAEGPGDLFDQVVDDIRQMAARYEKPSLRVTVRLR